MSTPPTSPTSLSSPPKSPSGIPLLLPPHRKERRSLRRIEHPVPLLPLPLPSAEERREGVPPLAGRASILGSAPLPLVVQGRALSALSALLERPKQADIPPPLPPFLVAPATAAASPAAVDPKAEDPFPPPPPKAGFHPRSGLGEDESSSDDCSKKP